MEDYYALLGIEKNCSEEDLDFHYKEIVNFLKPENHPNKFYSLREIEEVQSQLAGVNEAYRVLKDPKLRKEYDEALNRPKQPEQPRARRIEEQRKLKPVMIPAPTKVTVQGPISRRKVKEKKTFWQNVRDSYREVRADEKRMSFAKRHAQFGRAFEEEFGGKVNTLPKEILFQTGKGTAHVFAEAFYQLSRLSYINRDTVTKYVIRNRRLIALALAVGIISSCGWFQSKEETVELPALTKVSEEQPVTKPIEIIIPEAEEPRLVLNRYYTIVAGDTLSRLAYTANSSVEELKRINGYEDDKIYYGRTMLIPYTIDREDLEYYTESVKLNDFTVEEIARAYETDMDTLIQLNRGAIYYANGHYYALSDSILVPRFPTKQELQALKEEKSSSYE